MKTKIVDQKKVGSDVKFSDLQFGVHPAGHGKQARVAFENGYGASIVRFPGSYGFEEGLYEMAVLDRAGRLTYTTPVTDDVLGHLSESAVEQHLHEIAALPEAPK